MAQMELSRSRREKIIGGVCGGLAEYLNLDVTIVRVAFVLLALASGMGVLLYLLLLVIMPEGSTQEIMEEIRLDGEEPLKGERPLVEPAQQAERRQAAAVGLIGLGILFLLQQLGIISAGVMLPVMIIGIGAYLILRYRRNS